MTATRTYRPGGKMHALLDRLRTGPAPRCELRRLYATHGGCADSQTRRRKASYAIFTLTEDGLIALAHGIGFTLTRAGADAWACLEAGHPVVIDAGIADAA